MGPMSETGRHVYVRGRVQGVAFRWSAHRKGQELGLRGWVRNVTDGRVETCFLGDDAAIATMLGWLTHGPPAARVDDISAREIAANELAALGELDDFEIRATAAM
jgi:acylphosphatase